MVGKIFEGEMLTITLPTILLQIFSKIILHYKVIVKSMIYPGNNIQIYLLSFMGQGVNVLKAVKQNITIEVLPIDEVVYKIYSFRKPRKQT